MSSQRWGGLHVRTVCTAYFITTTATKTNCLLYISALPLWVDSSPASFLFRLAVRIDDDAGFKDNCGPTKRLVMKRLLKAAFSKLDLAVTEQKSLGEEMRMFGRRYIDYDPCPSSEASDDEAGE